MELNELQQKVQEFDRITGFDKTKFQNLIEMIKEEVAILEKAKSKDVINHELTDLLILIMQIAHRNKIDFDKELENWFKKSRKYINK